jgi:hypothetical protein
MTRLGNRRRSTLPKVSGLVFSIALLVGLLAPAANAQVGGVIDAVGDAAAGGSSSEGSVAGTIADGLEGRSSESSTDGASDDGGDPVGLLDGAANLIEKTSDTVKDTTTGGGDKGPVAGVVNAVTGTLQDTTDDITNSGGKTKKNNDGGSHTSRHRSGSRNTSVQATPTEVLAATLADALRADARRLPSQQDAVAFVASPEGSSDSLVTQIGRIAAEAAQQAAFPLLLILMVLAFLMVQNRIDSRDPKLALAPMDTEHDSLSFT